MNKSQETIEITYPEEGVSALQISGFRMRVRTKRHDHWTGYSEMAFYTVIEGGDGDGAELIR